jgi:hypothetical protein
MDPLQEGTGQWPPGQHQGVVGGTWTYHQEGEKTASAAPLFRLRFETPPFFTPMMSITYTHINKAKLFFLTPKETQWLFTL